MQTVYKKLLELWPGKVAEFTMTVCFKISYPGDNKGYTNNELCCDLVRRLMDKGQEGWSLEEVIVEESEVSNSDGGIPETKFGWTTKNCELIVFVRWLWLIRVVTNKLAALLLDSGIDSGGSRA
jgi:hypothetical protein